MSVYSWLFRSVIHRTDPERAHHAGLNAVAWAGRHGLIRALMRATMGSACTLHAAVAHALAADNR